MKVGTPTKMQRVPETNRKVSGFLSPGRDGMYFHRALEAAKKSITASACLDARSRFTAANGLLNKELADLVVNRQGQTLDDIIAATSRNVGKGEYISLQLGVNGLGKYTSIRPVSFDIVQYAKPDDLGNINKAGIFPYMNSTLERGKANKYSAVLDLFNPNAEVIQQQIQTAGGIDKYYGQLLFDPMEVAQSGYYHIADWMEAGINDIETEYELGVYNYRIVTNSFSGSGFLITVEEPENPNRNPDVDGAYREDENSIVAKMEATVGNKEAGNTVVLTFKDKDTANAVRWLESSGKQQADRYSSTKDDVKNNICTVMKTPGELANIRRTGGMTPTGDEIKVASQLMQLTVNAWQRKIEQTLVKIFSNWHTALPSMDFTIENKNYFTDKDENATMAD